MVNKIIGIMLIILAIKVIFLQDFSGAWSSYKFSNNYLFIPLGLLLIYIAYMFLRYNPKDLEEKYSKCPKCKRTFVYKYLNNGNCDFCKGVKTIDLDECYEKFPDEIKNEDKKKRG